MTLREEIMVAFIGLPSGRDDGIIAATMSKDRTKIIAIPAVTVRGAMYAMGIWPAVVSRANAARANMDSTPLALVCQTLYDLALSDQPIPMDKPAVNARVTADLNLIVMSGLMSSRQEAYILSLASVPDVITPAMVAEALEGI